MSGRVVHFEIPFDDGERARTFYREAFGWDLAEVPGMDYTMVSTGPATETGPTEPGFINGGMAERSEALPAPNVVLDVPDIDTALARIADLGGSTILGRTPVGDMGFSAVFRDPEGNVLGLWESPPTP
jgi:uncharacterized protein